VSINNCFKRFGKLLSESDKQAIRDLVGDGYTEVEAVRQHIGALDTFLQEIADRAQSEGAQVMYQPAYHGTPHDVDRFSTDHIGTGEGAQAYGWGLYFAGKKEVAEWYKKVLTEQSAPTYKGVELERRDTSNSFVGLSELESTAIAYYEMFKGGREVARRQTRNDLEMNTRKGSMVDEEIKRESAESLEGFDGKFDEIIDQVDLNLGNLYKVELAPEEDEYLLWDKPLSEQSEKVRELLEDELSDSDIINLYARRRAGYYEVVHDEDENGYVIIDENGDYLFDSGGGLMVFESRGEAYDDLVAKLENDYEFDDLKESGQELYKSLHEMHGSQRKTSEYLHSLGIRGIKYLDGTSRGKGEGDYNYVIFSDDDVEIIKMYQFAGPGSKTADLSKLDVAIELEESGTSNETIRQRTGWHKGVDGNWRYEISDDQATWNPEISAVGLSVASVLDTQKTDFDTGSRRPWTVGEVLNHQMLFAAYPSLSDIEIVSLPEDTSHNGRWIEQLNRIELRVTDENDMLSTLMHELQHAIQSKEEFARGGNADVEFTNSIKRALTEVADFRAEVVEGWKYRNKDKIEEAKRTAEIARYGLMYESMSRLIGYANRDKPSGVFRLIRNEMQWIYSQDLKDEISNELQRRFYLIPTRGKQKGRARNEYIGEMAWDASQWMKGKIPADLLKQFKEDSRTLKGMIKALEREASNARGELKQLHSLKKEKKAAETVKKSHEYARPYQVYRALAGEVEARNTQARMGMTDKERADTPPRVTADVPMEETIVIMGGMELRAPLVMMSEGVESPPRGAITLLDNARIIQLGKASDLSTFLHESAHLFLEMEKSLAARYGVSENQRALLEWLGVASFDDITVEHHEKFAETYEQYLMEGKAPSLRLKDAFAAFRRWLLRVYRQLRTLENADLTREITDVFDRMLATEAEIEEATANPAYDQYFRSKEQAGMSDQEWEAYQRRVSRARTKAVEDVDEKLIKEITHRRSQEWKEEKAPLIDEERERLAKEPVHQLRADTAQWPMNWSVVKEITGMDKFPPKLKGVASKAGEVDPAEYAEAYGFNSVPEMIAALVDTPTIKQAAEAAAEARMIEKYGDILNEGTIESTVRDAIHNEEQAKLLLTEIKALAKQTNRPDINRDYLKAQAKQLIGSMKFKEIKPAKFYRAEIRAAKNAVSATPEEAYRYKVQQLANHYLYQEAVATREAMKKYRRYVKGVQTRKYDPRQVEDATAQNMKTLANLYDLRTNTDRQLAVDQVLAWYQTQIDDPNQFVDVTILDPYLIAGLEARERGQSHQMRIPEFDDLTAEELRGVYDMLRHMRYVGGRISFEQNVEFAADAKRLSESIEARGGRNFRGRRGIPEDEVRRKNTISHLINSIPSLRNLVRKLDGFKDVDQEAFNQIYRVVEDANSRKMELQKEMYDRFESELNGIHKVGLSREMKTYPLEDGTYLDIHAESRFMMAMYWGTETGREAIRNGFGVTDADVVKILSDMTQEQLQLVNAVWRVNETLWPDLSNASVHLYGVAPPKLDPMPFTINGVDLTGGHMRLFYDSTELELNTEQAQAGKRGEIMPTKAGSLHARVGSGGRPPMLDKNNIVRAINENVHFIAFAEPGDRLKRLLKHSGVKGAIEQKHGEGFYRALLQNIEGVTGNRADRETFPGLAKMFRLLRRAATFKHLAYSVRNTVQQFSAIPVVVEEVGLVPFVQGVARFSTPSTARQMKEFVDGRSKFMADRASVVNREAAEYLRNLTVDGKYKHAWSVFAKFGFTPQTIADSTLAYPTWIARYEQSMEKHGDDKRAVSEADSAVAESVGSGSDLHLGAAFHQGNTEFVRTFTMFGTWFNAYYQRVYRNTRGGTEFLTADAIQAIATTPIVVSIIASAVIMDGPDGDDEWWKWVGKQYLTFMAGTVPILRDVASAFSGFAPKTVWSGAGASPAKFVNEMQALAEGRQTGIRATSDITKLITTVVPVPGVGNVTRVLDYMDSADRGKERDEWWSWYQAIVEGPDRNK
jgi:hypothetical protein